MIGGLGSVRGAFFGSLFLGTIDTFGKALVPQFTALTIFVPMVLCSPRPTSLFGRSERTAADVSATAMASGCRNRGHSGSSSVAAVVLHRPTHRMLIFSILRRAEHSCRLHWTAIAGHAAYFAAGAYAAGLVSIWASSRNLFVGMLAGIAAGFRSQRAF